MVNMDVSQPLSVEDENNTSPSEQNQREEKKMGYCKELWQSFNWIYLRHKYFDEKYWKLVFCSSSFDIINKYPNIILIYRTVLFAVTIFHLTHGVLITRPMSEWAIYYTHLTLLIMFLAILFQLIITYRVNFYRGNDIVPRHSLQYIHTVLILISLGSGLAVCLFYWTVIYHSSVRFSSPKLLLDHGILWFLLFIDIFLFTRLPIYMIDCIPLVIFASLYGIFTLMIYLLQWKFSRDRVGFVYRAFNFNDPALHVTIQSVVFLFVVPCGITFILWNFFRLRRSIDVKISEIKEEASSE